MITLNNSRQEELICLLDTLEEYLELKSDDGKTERQILRNKLVILGGMVRKRIFQLDTDKRSWRERVREDIENFENEGGSLK